MVVKNVAGRVAALVGLLVLLPSQAARALDIELPGERKLEVHGFYEFRFRAMGEDIPFGEAGFSPSVSSFRHVLNVETDIDIFPDGWGPFDFMVGYTRWLVSYECAYQRGCGSFPSIDSFGGAHRDPVREPANFKKAYTRTPYAGGVFPQRFFPGSLLSTYQRITPGGRYRDIINPDGVFWNPFPLAPFANLNTRTALDQPIDGGTSNSVAFDTRAGVQNPDRLIAEARLVSSRPELPFLTNVFTGEPVPPFQVLSNRALYPFLDPLTVPGSGGQQLGTGILNGVVRGQFGLAGRADADPQFLRSYGIAPAPAGTDAAALRAAALDTLLNPASVDPNVPAVQSFDSYFPNLIQARPDRNKFVPLAEANSPDLLTMLWGATARADSTFIPWIATIDTSIRPEGYFTKSGADLVNEFATGAVSGIARRAGTPVGFPTLSEKQIAELPPLRVSSYCRELEGGMTVDQGGLPCVLPDDGSIGDTNNRLIPTFTGPDGVQYTADDLLISKGPVGGHPLYLTQSDQDNLKLILQLNPSFGLPVDPNTNEVLLEEDGSCNGDGVNANGECVLLMAGDANSKVGGVLDPAVLPFLGDPDLRPPEAIQESAQVTDFEQVSAGGSSLPARPRNPDGGLFYKTGGLDRFYKDSSSVISNLDLDFTEDELRWEHGASQQEHEFREGYIEFEMMDSEIFTRVGKLLWVWGKTELFRNQDRLNPIDIGLGALSRLEESRVGQWGFQVVYSPEAWMSVGPVEDMRLEYVMVLNQFTPTDLGKCGESLVFAPVCNLTFGSMAHGLTGIGIAGETRPNDEYSGLKQFDYGLRLEGRWNRFTFAITDFWGWDDGLLVELVNQYQRKVDPDTGAPVNVSGGRECKIRRDANGVAIGPDAVAGTADDLVSSVGNCLLYSNPENDTDPQVLRASDQISLNHYANQTLFHTICTLTFDGDAGSCAVDQLNSAALFGAIAAIISGDATIGAVAVLGVETVRTTDDPFTKFRTQTQAGEQVFAEILTRQAGQGGDLGLIDVRQRALLGCGAGFATGCGQVDAIGAGFLGGIDFMNADASVITQDFTTLKVGSPWALIGNRKETVASANQFFEAGITRPVGFTPQDAQALVAQIDPTNSDTAPWKIASRQIRLGPNGIDESQDFPGFGTVPGGDDGTYELSEGITGTQSELTQDPTDPNKALLRFTRTGAFGLEFLRDEPLPTDFLIEPPKWLVDPNWLDEGFIVFQDARQDPSQPLTEANLDPNKINKFGEYCGPLLREKDGVLEYLPDPGCTNLEIISANFERLSIANEIIGGDDVFDPPESLAEIGAMFNLDPSDDLVGDPFAGADGIVFNNFDSDGDQIADQRAIQVDLRDLAQANPENERLFVQRYEQCADRLASPTFDPLAKACYKQLTGKPGDNRFLAGAMPIGLPGWIQAEDGSFQRYQIPTEQLDPYELQLLAETQDLSGEGISLGGNPFGAVVTTALDPNFIPAGVVPDPNGRVTLGVALTDISDILRRSKTGGAGVGDLDGDFVRDVDEDFDGVYDFVDDGTPGPITDDNILCGSGIPGDPLQDAVQYEFLNAAEVEQLNQLFGGKGLPPRSPNQCRSLSGVLGITGQTLPFRRAGGDGSFGRRDFLWHGGRQVSLGYQRRNTLGFSLDFAEDRTKSSWGFEFSWTSGKQWGNTLDFDGLHASDEYVLTVSVDRPTFFNFLNPNRSFFINFQFSSRTG
jgi:hypothetical protein